MPKSSTRTSKGWPSDVLVLSPGLVKAISAASLATGETPDQFISRLVRAEIEAGGVNEYLLEHVAAGEETERERLAFFTKIKPVIRPRRRVETA